MTMPLTILLDRLRARNGPEFRRLFLSAGAMKAGTTWLSQVLRQHPLIHVSPEKEIHFLHHAYIDAGTLSLEARQRHAERIRARLSRRGSDKGKRRVERWLDRYLEGEPDWRWYRRLFPRRPDEAYAADFSNLTCLLGSDDWHRLRDHIETLRVLYTLRDPFERTWSHLRFHLGLAGRLEELATWSPAEFEAFVLSDTIWPSNRYADNIAAMRAALSGEELRIAFYDDMVAGPHRFVAEVARFLSIDDIWQSGDYDEMIAMQINVSPASERPAYFDKILRPHVEVELEKLDRLGIAVPPGWAH